MMIAEFRNQQSFQLSEAEAADSSHFTCPQCLGRKPFFASSEFGPEALLPYAQEKTQPEMQEDLSFHKTAYWTPLTSFDCCDLEGSYTVTCEYCHFPGAGDAWERLNSLELEIHPRESPANQFRITPNESGPGIPDSAILSVWETSFGNQYEFMFGPFMPCPGIGAVRHASYVVDCMWTRLVDFALHRYNGLALPHPVSHSTDTSRA